MCNALPKRSRPNDLPSPLERRIPSGFILVPCGPRSFVTYGCGGRMLASIVSKICISALPDSTYLWNSRDLIHSLLPYRLTALCLMLLRRSDNSSTFAVACRSVILVPYGTRSAVRSAAFCTLCRRARLLPVALHVATYPVSRTGRMYCLYSFSRVLWRGPHFSATNHFQ